MARMAFRLAACPHCLSHCLRISSYRAAQSALEVRVPRVMTMSILVGAFLHRVSDLGQAQLQRHQACGEARRHGGNPDREPDRALNRMGHHRWIDADGRRSSVPVPRCLAP